MRSAEGSMATPSYVWPVQEAAFTIHVSWRRPFFRRNISLYLQSAPQLYALWDGGGCECDLGHLDDLLSPTVQNWVPQVRL